MNLYSAIPTHRTRQIVGDVFMAAWAIMWIVIGRTVGSAVRAVGAPAARLGDAGDNFSQSMTQAADNASKVPLLGNTVAEPFTTAAGAGRSLQGAGDGIVSAVNSVATVLTLTIALIPILIVGMIWLLRRVRFVRAARLTQRTLQGPGGYDLLAIRALATQPLRRLQSIDPDPVAGFRVGDPKVVDALAQLECRDYGIKAPARA